MSYHQLYGPTRRERGRRMAANVSPPYTDPPPHTWKTLRLDRGYQHWCNRYVEDLGESLDKNTGRTHGRYIVVRSQKTRGDVGALYTITFRKTARWSISVANLANMTYNEWEASTCSCQDPEVMCKHKYAAMYTYNPAALPPRLLLRL